MLPLFKALAFAPAILAFPHLSEEATAQLATLARSQPEEKRAIHFDPVAQHVSVSGEHEWQAPNFAAGDQRGPCPGLNALANHGYLPRSGVVEWTQIATVTNQVFGLGKDISTFLAVYGAIFDGNILSLSPGYSIGGPSNLNQNILGGGGILGKPQGLSGSHNKYEGDASAGRYDLYNGKNDYKIDLSRYSALYALGEPYTLNKFKVHRKNMFIKSVNENPYFFYPPFAGVIATQGGYTFPPRMMSNKSKEHPDLGYLSAETLNSFFSVRGNSSDNFVYTYGYERIPENFYRSAIGNDYTGKKFFEDLADYAKYYPQIISTGGNTGKTNSYASLNLGNATGGLYASGSLLQGDNLKCFVFQSLLAAAPDILNLNYADITGPMSVLSSQVDSFLSAAGVTSSACPQIEEPLTHQYDQYAGYRKYGGGL